MSGGAHTSRTMMLQELRQLLMSSPQEAWELAQSLLHTMGGKGSAFTMGQRYVYLEELKTAKSTADLR